MRVLVVQTAFLGDVVLTTPLLRELRRLLPVAEIAVLTTPLGHAALRGLPWVDRRVRFDKRGSGPRSLLRLGRELRAARFDVVLAAHRSHRSALLIRLSGAPRRVGFRGAPGAWAYTERVPRDPRIHAVYRYLALAVPLGADARQADPRPELQPSGAARARVVRLLAEHGPARDGAPLLALAPGSAWPTKRWPAESFAAVAAEATRLGLSPLLVGSAADRALCEEVAATAGLPRNVLAGRTDVDELAALLGRCRALVGNDSGAAHVAAAVGIPTITIFGPTVPALGYAPLGPEHRTVELPHLACRPCSRHGSRRCPLGHFHCMRELPVRDVVDRLRQVLAAAPPPTRYARTRPG